MKPLVYDLYCGLGGWSEGFLANGYRCVGFDIEAHDYGSGGYPGELRLRDVRSIHGSELKDATCIVGSSPCQEFSYRAMPWKRAKALPPPYLGIELFNAQFRIQREASDAAGHYIPMVVENVRGAQKWVGQARYHFGSFYLWGDVPALMPSPIRATKVKGFRFDGSGKSFQTASVEGMKNSEGGSWFGLNPDGSPGALNNARDGIKVGNASSRTFQERRQLAAQNPDADPMNWWHSAEGKKVPGISLSAGKSIGFNVTAAQRYRETHRVGEVDQDSGTKQGGDWSGKECSTSMSRMYSSRSNSRKAASAMIAKIPFVLADWIAKSYLPIDNVEEIA